MFWPSETRTSTCRNFATISSGLYRFLAIAVLLDVKDIPQVGPLQRGRITPIMTVPFPLFHGTSDIFLPSIRRHGLGGKNIVVEWRVLEFLRIVMAMLDPHVD